MSRPLLVVYCGLPGVGKSLASAYTAEQLSATRYRSDELRKQLFPEPTYTETETELTYEAVLSRGQATLESGSTAVLDATFRSKRFRDWAAATARDAGVDTQFVRVTCDVDIVRDRIENRTDTVSDATFDQHLKLRRKFEPIERDHVVIDNSGSIAETKRQIDRTVL